MRARNGLVWLLGCWLASLSSLLWADKPQAKPAVAPAEAAKEAPAKDDIFLRVLRNDKDDPIALQTSIARYVPAGKENAGVTVDLIGAVHVGDKSYYDDLNKAFEQYDALLFELVAPEGTKIPKGGRKEEGFNPVSGLQRGMQSMLDLEFQLDCVDYTKPNFVHADMSPEEFAQSMKDRNESFLQMLFKMMGQGPALQAQNKTSDAEMLLALFSRDRSLRLKRAMASQFENLDTQMALFSGKDGSTIITERNKKALQVLEREIAAGKKKIGIFYGAGHLADMHDRLESDFALKKDSERWLTAWSMEKPAKKAKATKPAQEKQPAEAAPAQEEPQAEAKSN